MQKRLIILSDLWGTPKATWLPLYITYLAPHFDIQYYDVCELAGIDTSIYTEKNLHQQFVNGGINRAVEQLLTLENNQPVTILAFSIGGTIAWKAGLRGLLIDNFYAVSATRLRYETQQPDTNIYLYYGEKDAYQPNSDWFDLQSLDKVIFKNENHHCYISSGYTKIICNAISF